MREVPKISVPIFRYRPRSQWLEKSGARGLHGHDSATAAPSPGYATGASLATEVASYAEHDGSDATHARPLHHHSTERRGAVSRTRPRLRWGKHPALSGSDP